MARKLYDFLLSPAGARAIVQGYMHAPDPKVPPPEGTKPLAELMKTSFTWSPALIARARQEADKIKETYSRVMLE